MARRVTGAGDVALRYTDHGWPVLPLHTPDRHGCSCRTATCSSPGKHPRTLRGLRDATTDPDQVAAWWTRWPHANVGVATGANAGLLVVDVDLPDGPATLNRLEQRHGRLPATCEQRTGSGGRQLLFAHPRDGRVPNRTGLRPGIDVRGDGGYIVVPPSLHATGDRYRWTGRRRPAPAPPWLLSLLDRTRTPAPPAPPPAPLSGTSRARRYAAAALTSELARLATAVEGTRNDTLNRAAFVLGQLVGARLLPRDHVATQLQRVAHDLGLGPAETRRTVASGLDAGAACPRLPPAIAAGEPSHLVLEPAASRRRSGRSR